MFLTIHNNIKGHLNFSLTIDHCIKIGPINSVWKYQRARDFILWKSIISSRSPPEISLKISEVTWFYILKIDNFVKIAQINFVWKNCVPSKAVLFMWKSSFCVTPPPMLLNVRLNNFVSLLFPWNDKGRARAARKCLQSIYLIFLWIA